MRVSRDVKLVALVAALATGWTATACTPRESAEVREEATESSSEDLVATMEVQAGGDVVELTLHVTNASSEPIRLEFPSSQRYDFSVSRLDGEALWRWSADRMFAQALGTETLPAGGSVRYVAEWPAGDRTGEFVATGELTALNREVRQAVRFELADGE